MRALGNDKGAIADYDKAIELDPQYALAYNNRGDSKVNLGNYKRAIAYYNRGISKAALENYKEGDSRLTTKP